ncbi:MAG: hypothetical protein AB2696_21240 [Candidatus Thiodiazotropha sp.]
MKRIDQNPVADAACRDIRAILGNTGDKYSRCWAAMDDRRRSMHLRRAGVVEDKPWSEYSSTEQFLIRTSLKRVASTALADARMMGAIE